MRFLAIEHELPSRTVTNDEVIAGVRAASAPHLSARDLDGLQTMMEGLFASVGTTVRYHRAEGETATELAVKAGRRAIENSGLAPEDIDLLMYVGIGRGVMEPASGTIYQDMLGLTNATTFDVLDACASWVRALHMAQLYLQTGTYKNIMIMNAEFEGKEAHRLELKSLREFEHWHPSVTIGEATTATIVSADHGDRPDPDFEVSFRTWGEKRDLCFIPLPNVADYLGKEIDAKYGVQPLQFVSFGMRLMEFGAAKLVEHYRDLPQYKEFDADLIFGHGASDGMSRFILNEVGADLEKAQFCHRLFANTVSASVPLALSHAKQEGTLTPGQRLLVMVASAGVTTALAKFTYQS